MWIEVLLLAKLAKGPSHGYELRKAVESSTGRALSNNSLYPTLRRFVDAGAVLRSAEDQEGKPPRHVYTITDVGRELLRDTLADLPADVADNDSEFLARLANFAWLEPTEQLRVLDARDLALKRERTRLAGLALAQAETWSRMVLDEVCRRLDAERAWLSGIRTEIEATPEEAVTTEEVS
ncbi:PadR family transcriptional regulator [Amycolatopsis pigmentata]|uniref:PadR family transcriptional regulator n=1 Tax=Amycolatopsis pigmentata TaxID=450801 RepID=A0ABW5FYX5_9PSEU